MKFNYHRFYLYAFYIISIQCNSVTQEVHRIVRAYQVAKETSAAIMARAETKLTRALLPAVQKVSLSFTGATSNDSPFFPPDTMGAVGPTQYIVLINGFIRSFNKSTGNKDNVLNTTLNNFFNSIRNNLAVGDARIRYDFFSKRWFIIAINFGLPNRILFAVSNTATISQNTVWNFFFFAQNDIITNSFADYPTLGIDKNALYLGINIFNENDDFQNTEVLVIPKIPIISGSSIKGFSFANLINAQGRGIYTPQGVDNFDVSATTGYFIGVDASLFNILVIRRISNPGTSPTISGNIFITVPATSFPSLVPHKGNNRASQGRLDAIDDRLMCAHIRGNKLWTVHNIGVTNTGISTNANSRNGCRWYQLNVAPAIPTLLQSGTSFTSSSSNDTNQRFYWMPAVLTSGQGHMLIACSTAGTNEFVNAAIVGRLASDFAGTLRTSTLYTTSSTAYNPSFDPGSQRGRRWGDYANVSLDPNDNMTFWSIAEFCAAINIFGVRVAKVLAPPPATPISISPSTIARGQSSVALTITGKSINGSGFYDPGAGFLKRLRVQISGGITVKNVSFQNATKINLTVATTNATTGFKNITVINPDDQKITATGLLHVT